MTPGKSLRGSIQPSTVDMVHVVTEASQIPFPHASRRLVQADAFMILAWIGNTKLPNWHRNVDVDELWIHYQGPVVTVTTDQSPTPIPLREGEMLLIPRGVLHTSDAAAEPLAIIAIAERRIVDYDRRAVDPKGARLDAAEPLAAVSWNDEIGRYTPPWRYPQVRLLSADAFDVEVMARAEGSLRPRGSNPRFDEVWLVMKGRVQIECETEGDGPIVEAGWMARIPAGLLHRPVALEPWTAALVLRGKDPK